MDIERNDSFIDYINEDKSLYKTAAQAGYIDLDNDFLIGDSGGFLFNFDCTFIDTYKFSEAARYFEDNASYTYFEIDSPEWNKFREQEEYRREFGLTMPCKLQNGEIKDLHITGEHYNFLNYGRIMLVDETSIDVTSSTAKKDEGFPRFFGAQYWYFKAKEFARNNGYNLIIGKARRGGFSYMEGIGSANTVNLRPRVTITHGAYLSDYVTKGKAISKMAQTQLNFYEKSTPFIRGGFNKDGSPRGLLKKTVDELVVGYKDQDGTEAGYLSTIISVSAKDNPDVSIGKDCVEIKLEELSNFPNLKKTLDVTEPTTRAGSYKTGIIIGFGTGGSREGNWIQFEELYYNPGLYNFMPFENIWDKDSRSKTCGYFKPYWTSLEGVDEYGNFAMDKDGNSIYEVAMRISETERLKQKEEDPSEDSYTIFCAQNANFPAESFSAGIENVFSSPDLNTHINNIRNNPDYKFYRDGMVIKNDKGEAVFKTNEELKEERIKTHPYITNVPFRKGDDLHGCIREFFPPFKTDGVIPDNLYYIGYDPVGIDKKMKEVTTKNSLNAMYVMMYPNNIANSSGDVICAIYVGRTEQMEDVDRIALLLSERYNCKTLVEVNRGVTVASFRKWGVLNKLHKNPISIISEKLKENLNADYGVDIGSKERSDDGILYLKDVLYTPVGYDANTGKSRYVFHYITDVPTLLELQKFNSQGNFDRVKALCVCMYQRLAYRTKNTKAKAKKSEDTTIKRLSLYGYGNNDLMINRH